MPEKVLNQIKYLCKKIPRVEWSGVLFYSVEGSIKEPENLVFTLENILPMHKGTSGYTEYELGESVIEYMMENEEAENWKMGHIHSHNTMNVFFSGTDWSELEDNAPNHNFYLSLIVNNFMDFCAKVCFIAESDKAQFTAKDENGKRYHYSLDEVSETKLVVYDCDIESPVNVIEVEDDFRDKVNHIIEEAEAKPTPRITGFSTVTTSNGVNKTRITPVNTHDFVGKTNPGIDAWADPFFNEKIEGQKKPGSFSELLDIEAQEQSQEDQKEEMLEEFTKLVVNTGNDVSKHKDLEDVLDVYKAYNLSAKALAKGVLDKYLTVYNNYFSDVERRKSPEMYIEITEGVIECIGLEVYTTNSNYVRSMLKPIHDVLENMLTKFKEYELYTSK